MWWNLLSKMAMVGSWTMPRIPCHGSFNPLQGPTRTNSLRSISAWQRTRPLYSKITLERDCVGGTVIDLLPVGAMVQKGEVIALVEKQVQGDKSYTVPVVAPHPGQVTQWYAQPSQSISIGQPLLELDSQLSFLQDIETTSQSLPSPGHVVVDPARRAVRERFVEVYLTPLLERHASEPVKQALIYIDWAEALGKENDYQGALEQYLQALHLLQKVHPSGLHPLVNECHFCMGEMYRLLGHWNLAVHHTQTSLELKMELEGHSCHPQIAISYNNIGGLYSRMRNYHDSKKNLEIALDIIQQISVQDPSPNHSAKMAGMHYNLGQALRHLKEYESAQKHLQKSVDIQVKLHQEQSQTTQGNSVPTAAEISSSIYALGQVYAEMGIMPGDAVSMEWVAQSKVPGTKALVRAGGYMTIGSIHLENKDFEAALQAYNTALTILQRVAPIKELMVHVYNLLGVTSCHLKQYLQSLEHYRQCRLVLGSMYGKDHPILALVIQNIGKALQQLQQYDAAMLEFQTAHAMFEKSLPPDHPDIAKSFINMGLLWSQLGQKDQALQSYQSAVQHYTRTMGRNHPDTGTCHFDIGSLWKSQGQLDQAKQEFQKAREIWIEAHGSHHPNVAMAAQEIQDCESSSA